MICIDSSGWIEYFLNGTVSERYADLIEGKEPMATSPVIVYEVYKVVKRYLGDQMAVEASQQQINRAHVVPLTPELACEAADESAEHHLSMADSIIYATAKSIGAKLVTSDADFKKLSNVTYIPLEEKN